LPSPLCCVPGDPCLFKHLGASLPLWDCWGTHSRASRLRSSPTACPPTCLRSVPMPARTTYHRLQTTGLCVKECGRPALPLRKHCGTCLPHHNAINLSRKHRYQRAGLCRECGKPRPPESTHVRCDRCHVANSESARRTRRLRYRDLF
jgi:hypothetical protein